MINEKWPWRKLRKALAGVIMAETHKLLIYNARQLLTCAAKNQAKRGAELADLGIIEDGAVYIEGGIIRRIGSTSELMRFVQDLGVKEVDAGGRVVMPGLIDSHTHIVHAGQRLDEFEMRIAGAEYMDILQAGGGILASRRALQDATLEAVIEQGRRNIEKAISFGVTTIEAKSGYGLDTQNEIKQLRAIKALNEQMPIEIVPTFLGAHAVPPEYDGYKEKYVDLIINEMIPEVARLGLAEFIDVFVEKGVFSVEDGRRIIAAGRDAGMRAKIHADEMSPLGGAQLAVEMDAASADHLLAASDAGIKALGESDTVACLLPGTSFFLKKNYAYARDMIDAGCIVALATDNNPGSSRTENIQLIMTIACLYLGLSPAEAINACTINAAAALRRADRLGSLEEGKQGDVVIMDVKDYREIAYHYGVNHTWKVFKGGREIYNSPSF